ncbi:MAG: hypothetical protein AAB271_01625, partial [Nitrospirota bacterium]
ADQTKRSDGHIVRQFRARMNYCCRMNLHAEPPMGNVNRQRTFVNRLRKVIAQLYALSRLTHDG